MICDILPYIKLLIAPEIIREVMPDFFNPYEKLQFATALDLMVYFDIRLLPP
jgi:hypothetical protein